MEQDMPVNNQHAIPTSYGYISAEACSWYQYCRLIKMKLTPLCNRQFVKLWLIGRILELGYIPNNVSRVRRGHPHGSELLIVAETMAAAHSLFQVDTG